MTVGQFRDWSSRKGGGGTQALSFGPTEVASADPAIGATTPQAAINAVAPPSGAVDPSTTATAFAPDLPPPTTVASPPAVASVPTQVAQASPTASSGLNPALIKALTDPRASAGTKQIAQILLQQQFQREQAAQEERTWRSRQDYTRSQQETDPLRQLQIQKAQRDLAAPTIPDSVQALDVRAQRAGLKPGTPEYNRFMLSGGDKGITINNEGAIPAGYRANRDADGRILSIEPIPGSAEAEKAKASETANQAKADGRETITSVITNAADRAREAATTATVPTDGVLGKIASAAPGSNAAEVRRQVGVLKSNATIETLNAMRQQSPTGGALGAVSDAENAMLAAKAGALDPDSPNFLRDLEDYERTMLRTVHGKEAGDRIFEQTRKKSGQDTPKSVNEMSDDELRAIVNGR